ncbi:MAG TPA: 30S ribosomal protein S11 [bacterium]|nr:30S ribosomal protein S11 [bacterium]
MGKKRVVKKSVEEVIKEGERVAARLSKKKLKALKEVKEGRVYISSSYNNTILTLTDLKGNTIYWTSAGRMGFSGTKEGTPFAASIAAKDMAQVIKEIGLEKVEVFVKGIGAGRDSALKTLASEGINIVLIKDVTPIPHDGPRPPKVRRV